MGKPVNKTLRIAAMSAGEEIGHVSGPIVTFRGNGDPLRSLLVNIDPVQDLHGYDSPWPAGGGKNLADIDSWADGFISTTGTSISTPSDAGNLVSGFIPVEEGVRYTYSTPTLVINPNFPPSLQEKWTGYAFYESADLSTVVGQRIVKPQESFSFVVPKNAKYLVVGSRHLQNGGKVQLEKGPTATPYAPYSNICPISGWNEAKVWVKPTYDPTADPTATIQLGQTIYGATLDVTNGVLTVDRAMYTFDGTEPFTRISNSEIESYDYFRWYSESFTREIPDWNKVNMAIMSCYPVNNQLPYWYSGGIGKDSVAWTVKGVAGICIREDKYATADELKAALVGQTMVYLLATPITIPLTPTEISTLQGQNNVWADCGDVDVKYTATGGEGGKLALLLRNRKELLIALRKGLTPAEAGLLNSTPLLGGFVRPGLSTDDEKEEDELI